MEPEEISEQPFSLKKLRHAEPRSATWDWRSGLRDILLKAESTLIRRPPGTILSERRSPEVVRRLK
jgi:hypothetical protein